MSDYAECHHCGAKTAMPICIPNCRVTVKARNAFESDKTVIITRYACSEECKQKIEGSEKG